MFGAERPSVIDLQIFGPESLSKQHLGFALGPFIDLSIFVSVLVGLETYVEALSCGRSRFLESHPSLSSCRLGGPPSLSRYRLGGAPILDQLDVASSREALGLGGPIHAQTKFCGGL